MVSHRRACLSRARPAFRGRLFSAFADISLAQLGVIAGMALIASVIGGVAGYGTGALMPLVLVPIVGAEPVVPIIAMSALLTNTGRIAAFRRLIDPRRALIVLVAAVPTCLLGAWGYTMLTGKGALLVIGGMMVTSVPLRWLMRRRGRALSDRALAAISFGIGIAKVAVFGIAGAVGAREIAIALLIGGVALPGAFLARTLVTRMPVHVHTAILDAVVIGGGAVMVLNAFAR